MDFKELVTKRYSCKKYDGRQIEKAQLDAILEAGRWAPTAKNTQIQRVYVIQSEEGLKKVDDITVCRYGAPTVLMVCYDKTGEYEYPGAKYHSGPEDAAIVATHMMLAAADLGVESCWLNRFDPDQAKEVFDLPENEVPVMLLDLGYASEEAAGQPLPNHASHKELSETVKYI